MKTMRAVLAAAMTGGLAVSGQAGAQTFVDVFAGRSSPERTAATLTANEARINGQIVPADLRVAIESLKPTRSDIYGARVGHWFGPFGIALDAATLDPDVKRQTLRATANLRLDERLFGEEVVIDPGESVAVDIPRLTVPTTATFAALAMVRVPAGGVEPYAFAGPAYLVTDADIGGNWGLRAGAGTKLMLTRWLGVFAEYRYTRVAADAIAGRIGGEVAGNTGTTGDIRIDLNIRNHSAVGGLSFNF